MTKKILYLLVGIFFLTFTTTSAQFDRGDKILDLGFGVNSALSGGLPLHASFEVGVSNALSVGASLDFLGHRYRYASVDYGYVAFYPAARVSYHFNKLFKLSIEELDIYGGGSLGFRSVAWKDGTPANSSSAYDSNVFAAAHVGARWYFKPSFGVFAEVGAGGASNAKAGIVLRF